MIFFTHSVTISANIHNFICIFYIFKNYIFSFFKKLSTFALFSSSTLVNLRLPWWLSEKEFSCQCRRRWFDPWVRNIPWRRKWLPTQVFLPGKSHGQKSLVGYSPWGCKKVRYDWTTLVNLSFSCFFFFFLQCAKRKQINLGESMLLP